MRNLSNTNVKFVTRALAEKKVLKDMYNLCMKTSNLSNVIDVIIWLSIMQALENTLNVFMKISNHTNVIFVKRALV
jgi:hypothetical protein